MPEPNAERIAWIRKLSKGGGLMRIREDAPLELFGADSWLHLVLVVNWARTRLPRTRPTVAVMTALNLKAAIQVHNRRWPNVPNTDLSDRRRDLALELDVSERTVMRLEEEGAEALSDYLERMTAPLELEELWARWAQVETEMISLVRNSPLRKPMIEILHVAAEGMWGLLMADETGQPYPRETILGYNDPPKTWGGAKNRSDV